MGISEDVRENPNSKLQAMYKNKVLPYVVLVLVFLIVVVPLILKPEIDIYDARDETSFHYPTILNFLDQFPALELANYRSATTPLYHVILMFAAQLLGPSIVQLRLISSIFSLGCLLVFYGYLSKRGDSRKAFIFAALLLFSPYFIGPAVRLSTDNAALLLAIASIYTMEAGSPNTKNFLLTNVFILGTVLIRQVYAWLVGAYVLFNIVRNKLRGIQWVSMLFPTLIPIGGLAYFVFLWDGLTPPPFAGHFSYGLNWDVPVFIVSLVGLYGLFFSPWYFKLYKQDSRLLPFVVLMGFAIGYLLLHPVSNQYPVVDGSIFYRGGALWLIASRLPNFLSSAIVFWFLFPMGLGCLYLMARYLASRREYLMMICFTLWLAANVTNKDTYQKYYEPFLLLLLGYVVATIKIDREKVAWIGPLILLAGFVGIAITRFFL
jgi:hypothetical protein